MLIQSYGNWDVPANSILTTRGDGEHTANLLATGEQLGQYAAADIQSGSVAVGDGVYYRNVKESTQTTENPPPLTPPAPANPLETPKTGQE
ncbi:MAG: hypothetical protein QM680_02370 [Luteolibacter sp.]